MAGFLLFMQPKQQASLDQFNFQGNPYLEMIQSAPQQQQSQSQSVQGQGGASQGQGMGMMQGAMMGGKQPEMPEDQLRYGEVGDASRDLVSAINSIENYIKRSTDRDQISLGRQLILMIGRLMQSDQEEQLNKLGGQGQPQS